MDIFSTDLSMMFFRRAIQGDKSNITMDGDMYRVLVAIDEEKDLARVGAELALDPESLRSAVSRLVKSGLIEPATKKMRILDSAFCDILRRNLTQAIGPMGDFLVDDVMNEMSISHDQVPLHRAEELISRIAEHIPEVEKRKQFWEDLRRILPK